VFRNLGKFKTCHDKNAHKIPGLKDMDTKDVVKISYLLKYNLLELLTERYLSHILCPASSQLRPFHVIEVNTGTLRCTVNQNAGNYDFLNKISIGQYIQSIAVQKGLSKDDLKGLLNLSKSSVSRLFCTKSLRIKKIRFFAQYFTK